MEDHDLSRLQLPGPPELLLVFWRINLDKEINSLPVRLLQTIQSLVGTYVPGETMTPVSVQAFTIDLFSTCNIECACFLKSEEEGHILKSECVKDAWSPSALPFDWRMKQ